MKKKVCICILYILVFKIYALDYRHVLFSNSYENIERITDENVVKHYSDKLKESFELMLKNDCISDKPNMVYFRLYREVFKNAVIYRLIGSPELITDDGIEHQQIAGISQLIFFELNGSINIIGVQQFHYKPQGGGMYSFYDTDDFSGFETIVRNNVLKGVMRHKSENMKIIRTAEDSNEKTKFYKGYSNAEYYEYKDLLNQKKYKGLRENIYKFDRYNNKIEINSTRPLIDVRRPFMYTIQNAFDGNPATAYVEDTDNNLLFISVYKEECKNIRKIRIINGYSSNRSIYMNNNRVKKISDYYMDSEDNWSDRRIYSDKNLTIKDDFLNTQILEWGKSTFAVEELYLGEKYNDTCISELDFYDSTYDWIFGE